MLTTLCVYPSLFFFLLYGTFLLSLALELLSHQYEMIPAGPETGADWPNQVELNFPLVHNCKRNN